MDIKMRDKQYIGELTPFSAAEGIKRAYENANSLLKDAELLFENGRYERSLSLSVLAIEECGKSAIIRALLLKNDSKELKKEWQNYRKHTAKNLAWILPDLVENGARKLEDLRKIFDPKSEHGYTLDNLKQLSFYTDKFTAEKWSSPAQVVDKELAYGILVIARNMVKIDMVMTSEKELELWIKHLKPVQGKGLKEMKDALLDCYSEAASKGLIEEWKIPELQQFIE
jgi:AbiV family abortive infection protein